ncbi:MAG: pseudouridine synthase [Burkholderiales bacterium]|nr:pseudouridine synthase [Burkholderiales bacterium]
MELIRLNKYLKDNDICSRRKADEFIAKGYVKLNGVVVTELGTKVNPETDKIEILPELTVETSNFRYIVLNKPKGYVCSKNKADGKPIFELLPKIDDLSYAGRLDKDSHGLVILSNDGKFVYKVFGAEFAKEKEYIVRVNKSVTPEYLEKQSNGSIILDDKRLRPAKIKQVGFNVYKMVLTEGVNRQIRRMAEMCDYRVVDLKRIRIDNIHDRGLETGQWRELTSEEVNYIMAK